MSDAKTMTMLIVDDDTTMLGLVRTLPKLKAGQKPRRFPLIATMAAGGVERAVAAGRTGVSNDTVKPFHVEIPWGKIEKVSCHA